ncbi:MAG: 16S rRNA processing protein RimM [Epulopiscium sp. Nuni2H_MBin003]|nr:MAG: 16S rRNA processing protein RimM [Epulopiscium sp. Nuni2H_MBin003]
MEMFTIGKIINTHGIKGELRVLPTTEDNNRFKKLDEIYIQTKELQKYTIESVRLHKNFVLLKLEGVDDINDAEQLKNYNIKIYRKDSLPLEQNEYYISDLYGLTVKTQEGRVLGILDDILFSSANDVYVVKSEDTPKQLLIPAIKQCIIEVNIEQKYMIVNLLEGLEEI